MEYIDLHYKPKNSDLICLFRATPAKGVGIKQVASALASESSVGTWTKIKTAPKRLKKLAAKVFDIKNSWVKIAYPVELFEPSNMPQILSSIAGNIFGMKIIDGLRLEDIKWPEKLMNSFRGPLFGIQGVRKLLGVRKRPLVGTIVKPKLGLNEKEHARVAYEAWIGGIDIVKDDENLSSLKFNMFEKRVELTLKMRDKAEKETGEKKVYMPNVTAETKEMLKRADFVKKSGGRYMMVDILTVGWAGLQTLRKYNRGLKLVMHAHRAMHAAFTRNKNHGISMLVLADIARLIGVDQIHIGTILGKMEGGKEEVVHIGKEIEQRFVKAGTHNLSENWHNIKPVFAVCSGGLYPGLIPKLMKFLGNDIILQAGGGVHGHPLGTRAGAKAMRQAVEAGIKKIPLKKYGKTHKELKLAIEKWGVK